MPSTLGTPCWEMPPMEGVGWASRLAWLSLTQPGLAGPWALNLLSLCCCMFAICMVGGVPAHWTVCAWPWV